MSEADTIHDNALPLTIDKLAAQLRACGLGPGQTVLLHSSLSALGWVCGGPESVIEALLKVLGPGGTLMVPTHTSSNTEPAHWGNPPVPEHWHKIIRQSMPAFDPARTPSSHMGAVAELFRTWPGVLRSDHPVGSFAALGPNAPQLLADHALVDAFGDLSPIGRLYALDGHVLLLGVGHANNTSLHLAEYRAAFPGKSMIREGTAMLVDGKRQWVEYQMLALETDDFEQIGQAFEAAHDIATRRVGRAKTLFTRQRAMVDFAQGWMEAHRGA